MNKVFSRLTPAILGLILTLGTTVLSAAPKLPTSISGHVVGNDGPEAGVWVIAETGDLPTNYIKIVVTDDTGRFVLPEMPEANGMRLRNHHQDPSFPVQPLVRSSR